GAFHNCNLVRCVVFYLINLHDMVAEFSFNQTVDESGTCCAKYGIFERLHHLAGIHPAKITAVGSGSVGAVLTSLRSEVSAIADITKDPFCLLTGFPFGSWRVIVPTDQN